MTWLYILGCLVVLVGLSAFFGAPYVPSRRRDMKRLFDQAVVLQPDDVVLDFGSGDGLVLREVSRRGATAIGYEIHPLFVLIARVASWRDPRVTVRWANGWTAAFPPATTIVYAFSVGRDGKRLVRTVQRETNRLQRSLTVVCYGNPLPGIKPYQAFEAYYIYHIQPLHPSPPPV